ncbi:MAG TPA: acetate--CoA ligase family protein [Myxococcota bacterium]|nr:acetate--CoA ligase family protein [Myxococcota bacterium]
MSQGGAGGLDAVFRPRSVAVIGASRKRGTIGAEIFANLLRHDFAGTVFPVNREARVVQSVRAYPTVLDIPDPVDLAVVVVPGAAVPGVVAECGRKGVGGLVVISAGFKETGEAGAAAERALVAAVRQHGMRMVGPNCLGVLNTAADVSLDATFAPTYPPAGNVAFLSQSGALGVAILDHARALGIGVSIFCSMGNKGDVSGNDLLEYLEADPATKVILLYLESFGNPRKFGRLAQRIGRAKPIVAVKSGRSAAGARAASSHTGSLAGADVAVDALCRQAGVIRVDVVEDLFSMAMLLAHQPVPAGPRVAILSNAGGPGILAADSLEQNGLEVATLGADTQARLRETLPPEASVRNPVDMIASATPVNYRRCAEALLAAPEVDALLAIFVPPITGDTAAVARAVVEAERAGRAAGRAKTVVCCIMGTHGVLQGVAELQEGGVPCYPYPTGAALALARAAQYGAWLARPTGRAFAFATEAEGEAAARRGRAALAGSEAEPAAPRWLAPGSIEALLGAYDLPTLRARTCEPAADAAAQAATRLRFPVALKIHSATITHKSDVGGVALGLATPEAVRDAARAMLERLEAAGQRGAVDGFQVQEMAPDGLEVIVGVTQDPSFGPLVMFGLGGVYAELLRDVAFRITPLTDVDAAQMVRSVRSWPLLDGYRGAPPADVPALEALLGRVGQMVERHPEILEMDLNPVRVLPRGRGVVVVDARVRAGAPVGRPPPGA